MKVAWLGLRIGDFELLLELVDLVGGAEDGGGEIGHYLRS
jgi:hypothetical protein